MKARNLHTLTQSQVQDVRATAERCWRAQRRGPEYRSPQKQRVYDAMIARLEKARLAPPMIAVEAAATPAETTPTPAPPKDLFAKLIDKLAR